MTIPASIRGTVQAWRRRLYAEALDGLKSKYLNATDQELFHLTTLARTGATITMSPVATSQG